MKCRPGALPEFARPVCNAFAGAMLISLLAIQLSSSPLQAWKAFSDEDELIRSISKTVLVGKLLSFSTQRGKGTEQRGLYTIEPKKMMKGETLKAKFMGRYMVPDSTMYDEKGIIIGFKSPMVSGSGNEWAVKPNHEYIFYLGEIVPAASPSYQILRIDLMNETPLPPGPLKELGK